MKNEKVCFNKSVGVITAIVIILGAFVFGATQLMQTPTSTSSRASGCPVGKDIGGGMYQCQANCGASQSGKCYPYVHNSPDSSCTQCNIIQPLETTTENIFITPEKTQETTTENIFITPEKTQETTVAQPVADLKVNSKQTVSTDKIINSLCEVKYGPGAYCFMGVGMYWNPGYKKGDKCTGGYCYYKDLKALTECPINDARSSICTYGGGDYWWNRIYYPNSVRGERCRIDTEKNFYCFRYFK